MIRHLLLGLALVVACTPSETKDTAPEPVDTAPTVIDEDDDGWAEGEDCDDDEALVNPDALEICEDGIDNDCDGLVDEADPDCEVTPDTGDPADSGDTGSDPVDRDLDGYDRTEDCDDDDATVFPGADERCDGIDNDCDGEVDESPSETDEGALDATTWYADTDEDGYADAEVSAVSCDPPPAHLAADELPLDDEEEVLWDCDDTDPDVNPGALEYCNGYDDDCDEEVDEGDAADADTWYPDDDSDGCGDADSPVTACEQPSGYVLAPESDDEADCDDTDDGVYPGAPEYCDGLDNDCNGTVDDPSTAIGTRQWYKDDDGDDYGKAADSTSACDQPTGYVEDATDCDDTDPNIHPGATEMCDGDDNDCDGDVDEDDAMDASTWYLDADGDGYGAVASTTKACNQPSGYVSSPEDCDDGDADVNPSVNEQCNDGVDNNCNGTQDESGADGEITWYEDSDGDGFGDASSSDEACDMPSGYTDDETDCDDGDPDINPDADEHCDGVDEDCDGTADNDAVDGTWYYPDDDGDGYGDESAGSRYCSAPTGYTSDDTDCDDTDASVNPGGTEVCDGKDNDCDGTPDDLGTEDNKDGIDNDCDDLVDENVVFDAYTVNVGSSTPIFLIDLDIPGTDYSNGQDLAIAGYNDYVYFRNNDGGGSFSSAGKSDGGSEVRGVSQGHFYDTDYRDVATVAVDGMQKICIHFGDASSDFGSGTECWDSGLTRPASIKLLEDCGGEGTEVEFVAVGDNNGDAIHYFSYDSTTSAWENRGSVTAGSGGNGPIQMREQDLDGDGTKDLVSANGSNGSVTVVLHEYSSCSQTTVPVKDEDTYSGYNRVSATAVGDFDGDGYLDIALVDYDTDELFILTNDGTGHYTETADYDIGSDFSCSTCQPEGIDTGQFNHAADSSLDLAIALRDTDEVVFYMGFGDGTFQATTSESVGASPREVRVADFGSGDLLDMAVANHDSGTVTILLDDGY